MVPPNHRKFSVEPIVLGISHFKKPSTQRNTKIPGPSCDHWGIWIFTGFGIQLRSLPPMDLPTETKQKLLQFCTSPCLDLGVPISESNVTRSISGVYMSIFLAGWPNRPLVYHCLDDVNTLWRKLRREFHSTDPFPQRQRNRAKGGQGPFQNKPLSHLANGANRCY